MLLKNRNYTGGVQGTQVGNPDLFGYEIGSITFPERYGIFTLAMLMLAVVVVANVRRGRSGRRLIAVRTNERAAAALGINVMVAKLFAFSFASAIAALGGIVLAFRLSSISYGSFSNFTSITYVGLALLGGVGQLLGAIVGSTLATAGITQEILETTWEGVGKWIQLISGVGILLTLVIYKDGIAAVWLRMSREVKKTRKWSQPYTIELVRRRRHIDRTRPHGAGASPHADGRRALGALRHGRRRQRRQLPARARQGHRPDRTERRRQDLAHRRCERIRRVAGQGPPRRCRSVEAAGDAPGPRRRRPVVPVARAVRGLDRVREPQRRRRSPGPALVLPRPALADQSEAPARGRAGDHRVRPRRRSPPRRARPLVRQAATPRHRQGGGDASECAAARRACSRPQLRGEHRAGAGGATPGRRLGHGDPGGRARHELRDGGLRPGDRARLRKADLGRVARRTSAPIRPSSRRTSAPRPTSSSKPTASTRRQRRRRRSVEAGHEGAADGDPQPQGWVPGARSGASRQPQGRRRARWSVCSARTAPASRRRC